MPADREEMTLRDMQWSSHDYALVKGFYREHRAIVRALFDTPDLCASYFRIWRLARLMLITTEVAEAAEAVRVADTDNFALELADIAIRLGDFSADEGVDLNDSVVAKMKKNADRPMLHGKKL